MKTKDNIFKRKYHFEVPLISFILKANFSNFFFLFPRNDKTDKCNVFKKFHDIF